MKGANGEPPTNTTGASGANNDDAATTADAQLRARDQAQDVAMCARLDSAEAALRGLISSLDSSLRVHVQEAVAVTKQRCAG